jgi:hypothetical protein
MTESVNRDTSTLLTRWPLCPWAAIEQGFPYQQILSINPQGPLRPGECKVPVRSRIMSLCYAVNGSEDVSIM